MFKRMKKTILTGLCVSMAVITVLQWDINELKANKEERELLLPEVSGMPHAWTNEMIQLSIVQNDTDYMYSFSDKEGYYNWQKENISDTYGQNTTVYVAVMNKSGTISRERKVELTKLDLFQPEINVSYEEKNGEVVFVVDAIDSLFGVKEDLKKVYLRKTCIIIYYGSI